MSYENLNDEQSELISHLLSSDADCVRSVLHHEEYFDDEEKLELEGRLELITSITDG